jgi:hypothetical protein
MTTVFTLQQLTCILYHDPVAHEYYVYQSPVVLF